MDGARDSNQPRLEEFAQKRFCQVQLCLASQPHTPVTAVCLMMFVASMRPPMPTSRITTSGLACRKISRPVWQKTHGTVSKDRPPTCV